jgi:hypothetical protein
MNLKTNKDQPKFRQLVVILNKAQKKHSTSNDIQTPQTQHSHCLNSFWSYITFHFYNLPNFY